MTADVEFFVADHAQALRHAEALDNGKEGVVPAPARMELNSELSDYEVDMFAFVGAQLLGRSDVDLATDLVDVDYDSLLELSTDAVEVLAELISPPELAEGQTGDLIPDVVRKWVIDAAIEIPAEELEPEARRMVALAKDAVAGDVGLYLWIRA